MKLGELLLEISYKLQYSPEDWAKKLNVSTDEVRDYFSRKKEIPILPFFHLINDSYPDYEKKKDIFSVYLDTISSSDNILYSLELVSQYEENEILQRLIDKGMKSEDPYVQEWAEMYALSLKSEELFNDDFLYSAKKASLKCNEMKIFLETMRITQLLQKINAHITIDKLADEYAPQLEKIENPFFRSAFTMRLHTSTINSTLRLNLIGKVRRIGEMYLNDKETQVYFPLGYCRILHYYALSFLYEDPQKALELIDESNAILETISNNVARFCMNENGKSKAFIKNVWEINQPEPDDIPEKIHYYIAKGDMKKAQALLIDLKKVQPLTAFQDYYWGVAFSDEEALQRSYERFRSNGDFFFAVLPIRALSKMSLEKLKEKKVRN
ncbi:MAG TPA: AimR family lysis-lysogeny pheromone receptor [Bacillus sp. (in: firmicutes)]|uniref:AimR family lysis-lysogeny pheromone receptor n=1 Tax=Bacillus litorisediminis TaxID=2922713 RepID=UPI001FAE23AB|nr:AimR family lysis-lysogeny pheromone receptor [Bacillus litorisediminis]HWO78162.1 AimR family lysis-lysogeny pheromone receptor [Bacillus sp. (in: firmicutes)]